MSMLTGLKVPSLARKCVNSTDQNIIKSGEGLHGTEFWRAWNAEMKYTNGYSSKSRWKNGVICLVIMFTPRVMVIKKSKMAYFLFSADGSKKSVSWDKIFKCIWKTLFSSPRKCYGLLDYELPLARYQTLKIHSVIIFLLTQQFFDIFTLDISQMVTRKPMNHTIFWKNSKRFRCTF